MVDSYMTTIPFDGVFVPTNTEGRFLYNNRVENITYRLEKNEEKEKVTLKPKKKKPYYLEIAEKKRKKQYRVEVMTLIVL